MSSTAVVIGALRVNIDMRSLYSVARFDDNKRTIMNGLPARSQDMNLHSSENSRAYSR